MSSATALLPAFVAALMVISKIYKKLSKVKQREALSLAAWSLILVYHQLNSRIGIEDFLLSFWRLR